MTEGGVAVIDLYLYVYGRGTCVISQYNVASNDAICIKNAWSWLVELNIYCQ